MYSSSKVQRLLDELEKLPGIGAKSAQRIAYWILNSDKAEAIRLADAIVGVKDSIHFCPTCFNYAEGDLCDICASEKRDHTRICVVSEPRDIPPIERTGAYGGVYHVLGGALSPMDGIYEEDLHIKELIARLADPDIAEVFIATNLDVPGETTASYLARLIKPMGITVTRFSSGMPVGGEVEFADEVTLARAIESRHAF